MSLNQQCSSCAPPTVSTIQCNVPNARVRRAPGEPSEYTAASDVLMKWCPTQLAHAGIFRSVKDPNCSAKKIAESAIWASRFCRGQLLRDIAPHVCAIALPPVLTFVAFGTTKSVKVVSAYHETNCQNCIRSLLPLLQSHVSARTQLNIFFRSRAQV